MQREQLLVVLRETKHNKASVHFILCFSGRALSFAGILRRGSTGKCKFVNCYYPFIFRDTAALFNYTDTIHGPQCSIVNAKLVLLNI